MKVQVEVYCPECGKKFLADALVSNLGRNRRNIPVKNLLHALQVDSGGYPQFEGTAKKYAELYRVFLDRGLIRVRLLQEAERQGITMLELGRKVRYEREKRPPKHK